MIVFPVLGHRGFREGIGGGASLVKAAEPCSDPGKAAARARYRAETPGGASWMWRATEEGTVRVLGIEDDQEMAETAGGGPRPGRRAADVALDGPAGLERALASDYDVIVLDRDLPGMHGDEVCGR